ncbi:hypothetical protein HALTITAN_3307 [Vreelandella titanicae BH1]|uniref:Uncharacterized protein n=1 Tax=Vreelandella titanicae BH1 TaxID=1204738 RepID=L9U5A7_9GAMM|nr:hypothetical protein HALTITAN_3307 [Halomonas titanicae BH1]
MGSIATGGVVIEDPVAAKALTLGITDAQLRRTFAVVFVKIPDNHGVSARRNRTG